MQRKSNGQDYEISYEDMGIPNDSLDGYFDQSKIRLIYTLSPLRSSDNEIYFDSAKKVVTQVIVPEGE